ncbi:MAG: tetratricopeptide repeat protein [Myxococcaceae bacterium]
MDSEDSSTGRMRPLRVTPLRVPIVRFRRSEARTVTRTQTEIGPLDEDTAVDEAPAPTARALSSLMPEELDAEARFDRARVNRLLSSKRIGHVFSDISENDGEELSRFAHFLFELEKYDDARVVLEALVSAGINDAFPHSLLGTVYLALGDSDRALALFEAALGLDDNDLAARVYRAEVRWQQGKLGPATGDLRHVVTHGRAGDPFVLRAEKLLRRVKSGNRPG